MKVITSSGLFLGIAVCIFYGAFPWRHRMVTIEADPYLFWIIMIFLLILGVAQLITIKSKSGIEDSET